MQTLAAKMRIAALHNQSLSTIPLSRRGLVEGNSTRSRLFRLCDFRSLLVPLEDRRHFSSGGSSGGYGRGPPPPGDGNPSGPPFFGSFRDGYRRPDAYGRHGGPAQPFKRGRGKPDPQNRNKENFDKKYLLPAARGELTHKDKPIPKLAGKHSRVNLAADPVTTQKRTQKGRVLKYGQDALDITKGVPAGFDSGGQQHDDKIEGEFGQKDVVFDPKEIEKGNIPKWLSQDDPHFALDKTINDKKYFWNEEDYDFDEYFPKDPEFDAFFEKHFLEEDGETFKVPYTDEDMKPREHNWIEDDVDAAKYFGGIPVDDDDEVEDEKVAKVGEGEDGGDSKPATTTTDEQAPANVDWDRETAQNSLMWDSLDDFTDEEEEKKEINPDQYYFQHLTDVVEMMKLPDSHFAKDDDPAVKQYLAARNHVLPLHQGLDESLHGFVEAMHEHPTDYAEVTHVPTHVNERREPRPMYSPHLGTVLQPPLEFLKTHLRFIYVTGLAPFTVNGEAVDVTNGVHRSMVEQAVAKLVDVDSTQVFAAGPNSAFVGFDSPRAMVNALEAGPLEATQEKPPVLKKYHNALFAEINDVVTKFVEASESPDCIIYLADLPLEVSKESLAIDLFPAGSELRGTFGEISPDNIEVPSRGIALIRLPSSERAESLLGSFLFRKRLDEMGQYTVRYLRARRELIHSGYDSLEKDKELRVPGPRLMIDGLHIPSKFFWHSHASAIYLHGLDPSVTDKQLTKIFQEYSQRLRFRSSIEFVYDELTGQPILGTAYVGFEEPHEALACRKALAAAAAAEGITVEGDLTMVPMKIGDRTVSVYGMSDRYVPMMDVTPQTRSARKIDELVDDMNNWQKFVDPADIEYLDQNGVPRVVIDEILRGVRRNNAYFGPFDSGIPDEQIEEGRRQGQLFRDLVVDTFDILKKAVVTRENPGHTFFQMFRPDEKPDYSCFDEWEEQKKDIDAIYKKYLEDDK